MFFTRGSLTFKEAYERTGRAMNVTVVPADRHSPTILLNHLTAPNCVIWSAIIASAAVPGILNPVVLMSKDRDGQLRPHNLGMFLVVIQFDVSLGPPSSISHPSPFFVHT